MMKGKVQIFNDYVKLEIPYLLSRSNNETEYITARVDLVKKTMAFQASSQLDAIRGTIALREVIIYSEKIILQGVDEFIESLNISRVEIIDKRK